MIWHETKDFPEDIFTLKQNLKSLWFRMGQQNLLFAWLLHNHTEYRIYQNVLSYWLVNDTKSQKAILDFWSEK